MTATKIIDIKFEDIVNASQKTDATCFLIEGEEVWLNNAQIEIDDKNNEVAMPEWYARKKGLT